MLSLSIIFENVLKIHLYIKCKFFILQEALDQNWSQSKSKFHAYQTCPWSTALHELSNCLLKITLGALFLLCALSKGE